MAIANTGTTTATSTGTLTDPSTAPGQFLLVAFGDDDAPANPITCTGCTQIANNYEAGDGGNAALLYNVNSGGVGGTLTTSATSGKCEVVVSYTGVDSTTPFDVAPTVTNAASGGSGTSWTVTAPSITTVTDGCRILIVIMADLLAPWPLMSGAASASGWTERGHVSDNDPAEGGEHATAVIVLENNTTQVTHGATGTVSVTIPWAASVSGGWVVYTVALRPSSGGGGGTTVSVDAGTDTPAVGDALARNVEFGRTPSDTIAATDSVSAQTQGSIVVTLSDTAAATDDEQWDLYSPADAVSTTDTTSRGAEFGRVLSDTASVTESTTVEKFSGAIDVAASDTVSVTDGNARDVQFGRSPSDTASTTDASSSRLEFGRSGADTCSTSDATVLGLELDRGGSDTASTSDATALEGSYSRNLADTASITDDVSASTASFADVSVSDSISVTDALLEEAQYVRAGSDAASATDSTTVEKLSPSTIDVAVSDTVGATDGNAKALEFSRAAFDTASTADATLAFVERAIDVSVSDTLVVADALATTLEYYRALADSGSTTDVSSRVVDWVRTLGDSLATTDSVAVNVQGPGLDVELEDAVGVLDLVVAQSLSGVFVDHGGRTIHALAQGRGISASSQNRAVKADPYNDT